MRLCAATSASFGREARPHRVHDADRDHEAALSVKLVPSALSLALCNAALVHLCTGWAGGVLGGRLRHLARTPLPVSPTCDWPRALLQLLGAEGRGTSPLGPSGAGGSRPGGPAWERARIETKPSVCRMQGAARAELARGSGRLLPLRVRTRRWRTKTMWGRDMPSAAVTTTTVLPESFARMSKTLRMIWQRNWKPAWLRAVRTFGRTLRMRLRLRLEMGVTEEALS
eukprot:SM000144S00659  [mRNA]  locus=s144:69584:70714:+ [translate_table: standard]